MNAEERYNKLTGTCKRISAFEYEGTIYLGNLNNAITAFMKAHPEPADFHVWLQDNYISLAPSK